MDKTTKKKLAAIFIIFTFAFTAYGVYDWTHHPYIMPPKPLYEIGSNICRQELVNVTPYGNNVEIGMVGAILGSSSNNSTDFANCAVNMGNFVVWIKGENLHVPFDAVTLVFSNFNIAVNGTVFRNFTHPYDRHDILPNLNVSQWFTTQMPCGAYCFSVNNGPDLSKLFANDMAYGSFTYWINVTVTPVLFLGPYYFPVNPIPMSLVFHENYSYPCWFYNNSEENV